MAAPDAPAVPPADALSELARVWRRYEGDPDGAIRAITEAACAALDVARSSVWLLDDDRRQLRCVDLYVRAAGTHAPGPALAAVDYPAYFAALASEEPLAATDALIDPRTREFAAGYLAPLGIGALLDAPLRTGGHLVGVVCNEHVGGARRWTAGDSAMLRSGQPDVAGARAGPARRWRGRSWPRTRSTGEGIVAVDDAGSVQRRFLEMWGTGSRQRDVAALRATCAAPIASTSSWPTPATPSRPRTPTPSTWSS
ncbi:MAG: GAF domain-containing protein [Kofleriaceae bacterium]